MGGRSLVVLVAVLAVLAAAPSAIAARGITYGIQDDAWVMGGPGTLDQRLDTLKALGVTTVRFSVRWNQVAPSKPARALAVNDPAYDWEGLDAILGGLHDRGIRPLVTLLGTPSWANGGRGPTVAPTNGSAFGDFAYAAAKRYPFVREWGVWSEPNQRIFLSAGTPKLYVTRLLNPAYAGIHRANPRALVAGGVTAPRGNSGGLGPIAWIRGMRAAHAKLDAYAHNPYPTRPSVESPFAGACASCDVISMANLDRLVKEVKRDFGNKPIWLTEYGYQTNPPDSYLGVNPMLQAQYVSDAALRAYQTPNVTMLVQFLLRDEPNVARFQSGLFTTTGKAKPAYQSFRIPLAQVTRRGTRTIVWGQVRPGNGAQSYRLQARTGRSWHWIGSTARTNGAGFLSRSLIAPRGTLVRVWSPALRAYSWPLLVR